jgi:hypothetical protein
MSASAEVMLPFDPWQTTYRDWFYRDGKNVVDVEAVKVLIDNLDTFEELLEAVKMASGCHGMSRAVSLELI